MAAVRSYTPNQAAEAAASGGEIMDQTRKSYRECKSLESLCSAARGIPAEHYLAVRRAVVRDLIAARLAFYSDTHPNPRQAAARAARYERHVWRRCRAGLRPVPLIYADGRKG